MLAPVANATYTRRGPVSRCWPGTREDVVGELMRLVDEKGGHPICWLNGPAGSGKSAIVQTVAEILVRQERLIGNFFFLRGDADRSIIARLIPTLSHQLRQTVPATTAPIQLAIEREPYIRSQSLPYQFQELVAEPIVLVHKRWLNKLTSKMWRKPE